VQTMLNMKAGYNTGMTVTGLFKYGNILQLQRIVTLCPET